MIVINQNEEETMQYIKLQLGCLLVILYIMAAYVKATKHEKMSCNRIYDALMAVTPLAVIFDGITAWTINHMDIVPGIVNRAAPLHDLGKIATPDRILQKPGKLTDEEFAIMKEHAARGGEIILNTFKNIDNPEFQQIAYEVARFHHEKYNGKGYPDGLAGEQIPLHARVMAIADVFDAVSQKRCYRDAMPVDQCFEIIEKGSGTDFDPRLTKLFLESRDEIEQLMERD